MVMTGTQCVCSNVCKIHQEQETAYSAVVVNDPMYPRPYHFLLILGQK